MITSRSHSIYRRRPSVAQTQSLPRQFAVAMLTFYAYSPKGDSEVSERSRQLCARVKAGNPRWLKSYVARVHHEIRCSDRLASLFRSDSVVIPVPNCEMPRSRSPWIARRLAAELQEAGLVHEVWTGLRRLSAVEKSSVAWRWERPTVEQHYRSFAVIPTPTAPSHIVVVDDVVTKGRTIIAASMRLQSAFPNATITAFALVRTMGLVSNIERLFEPSLGQIRWNGTDAYRDP